MPTAIPLRSGYGFGSPEPIYDFAHPPLIEVWLGVDFAADFGDTESFDWRKRLGPEWLATWQSIGSLERHSPGSIQIDRQLRNVMGDRAIRFHRDGFSFGWLGHDGSLYPRYETIRDGFVVTLDAVREMLPHVGSPARWTVSYVNRIPQGTVWTKPADWSFFRLWQPCPLQKLKIEPEGFAGRWQFPLEAERGTISIEFCHEAPTPNRTDIESLWLRITTGGLIQSDELFDGLDYGREMIVRAFSDLVSANAKEYWGGVLRKKSSSTAGRWASTP